MVHLRTLDECSFTMGETRLAPEAELLFAFLLLLSMERGRRIPRAQVVALLWPDAPEESARHCLRQTVYKLRQMGVPVESTASHLTLAADRVTRDFDALFTPSAYEVDGTGDATVVGDFLPGYAPRLSDAFGEWLDQQRIHVQTGVRRALLAALSDRRTRGRWLDVEALARRCLDLDPLNEEATLALAEAAAMSGAKARAIEILDTYLDEIGDARDIRLPAAILRKRIAERLPAARYSATDSCFVGRADSMAFLSERLKAARVGNGGGCLVWGDAGMGKTRLTHEFGRMATLQGALVQRVKCQASDPGRPLSIWVDIVPALLNLPGALGCSPRSLGYLKRLTEHDVTALEPSEETREAEFLYASVRQALFDLVDAVASEAPLVIVVEDVHWLDRMSWQVLREMIEWARERRLQFVLTSRTFGVTPEGRIEPVRGFDRHRLTSLAEEEATELLRAVLRGQRATLSDRMRGWCLSIGDGNPLYLRELCAYWLATEDTSRVPPTLEALIDERVARLGPDELRALQACAVLGANSTLERIEALLERRTHELLATLEELERYGLTHAVDSRVLVHHDLIGGAALKRASESALKLMHRRAGLLLEQEIERTQNVSLLWDCARHWRHAGEARRSLALARHCGLHLRHVGLPRDSVAVFSRALEYCVSTEERIDILTNLVWAHRDAGEWSALRNVCDEIFATRSDTSVHDDVELEHLLASWHTGDEISALLAQASACATDAIAPALHRLKAARIALMLADNSGDVQSAAAVSSAVAQLCDGHWARCPEALAVRALCERIIGRVEEAVEYADALVQLERESTDPQRLVAALRLATITMQAGGELARCREYLQEGFEISARLNSAASATNFAELIAIAFLNEGSSVEARKWLAIAGEWCARGEVTLLKRNLVWANARATLDSDGAQAALEQLESISLDAVIADPAIRGSAGFLALFVQCLPVDDPRFFAAMRRLSEVNAQLIGQCRIDYAIFGLSRGYQRIGQFENACNALLEFAHRHRRDRGALPVYMKNALAEASASIRSGADASTYPR